MLIAHDHLVVVKWPRDAEQRNRRLRAVLGRVKRNPGHHDQTMWHCGSRHCFAGFAELSACRQVSLEPGGYISAYIGNRLVGKWVAERDGGQHLPSTPTRAAYYLGLSYEQQGCLFNGCLRLKSLEYWVELICKQPLAERAVL